MLVIEFIGKDQDCDYCPFYQNFTLTCVKGQINYDLCNKLGFEFNKGMLICTNHSITLKPEYNGLD